VTRFDCVHITSVYSAFVRGREVWDGTEEIRLVSVTS